MPRNDGIFSFFAAALPAQIMNNFLSPDVINSFLGRTVEAFPENPSACTPSCEAVGRSWQRLGLRPGDVVLICLPSGKELMNQFFGVLLARGVPALAPPNMPAARLRELRQEFGARAIVAYRLPPVEFRGQTHEEFGGLRVAMFLPAQEPAAAAGEVVLLTSGTSGFASGCVFDFEALLLNGRRHADSIGQRQEDVVLVSLPLYFSFALVAQALASLVRGNRMIISGPPFNAARYQRTLREFGVTVSSLTPVLVRSLLQTDGDFLGELRVFSVGGDYAEPELVARLVDVREGGELYVTYGLTQAGPRVSTLAAHLEPAHRYSSVGRPMEGTTVCLRPASDGSRLDQLYVTSDTVMKRPIGSVEGRPHQDLAGQRTIATGDAFEQDDDGYLYFKGRLCDYISRRGEKISLAAVRRMASQLPNVASAKTLIIRQEDGDEDFDLELRLNASADAELDPREMLRGVLRRTEMPRSVRIELADPATSQAYK